LGGVLVGTIAFLLYEGELGLRLASEETARTQDIDIASFEKLSLALDDVVEPRLDEIFRNFEFAPVSNLDRGRVWRWRQTSGGALIEFLTPSFRDDEGLRDLRALGVSARALHHLEYLIENPIDAAVVYRDGVLVKAPRPERYAIHKLIVADRRHRGPDATKARKDMMQAQLLISLLREDRPSDLLDAYENAMARGPNWKRRIEASLRRSATIKGLLTSLR
jgi:hypothetical protein